MANSSIFPWIQKRFGVLPFIINAQTVSKDYPVRTDFFLAMPIARYDYFDPILPYFTDMQ